MYDAIKSNAISETEARELVGDVAVDAVLAENCDFSNRLIDGVFGVTEMSASLELEDKHGNEIIITVLYLVNTEEAFDCEDLGSLDYSKRTFTIE